MFLQPKPDVKRKMKISTSVPVPITNPLQKFIKSTSKKMYDIKEKTKQFFSEIITPPPG